MASKNLEVDARSTVKRVLGKLTPAQRMRLIADTVRSFGLPTLAMQIREHLPKD